MEAGTIISVATNFAAALIGALIGAWATRSATIRAARLALENERVLQNSAQRTILRGALLGIRTEVEAIWTRYEAEVGRRVASLPDGEPLLVVYKVRQEYFTVYESNCALIGQIPHDPLREAIIGVYVQAKSLLAGC